MLRLYHPKEEEMALEIYRGRMLETLAMFMSILVRSKNLRRFLKVALFSKPRERRKKMNNNPDIVISIKQ